MTKTKYISKTILCSIWHTGDTQIIADEWMNEVKSEMLPLL